MEDDALILCLDELLSLKQGAEEETSDNKGNSSKRVEELEMQIASLQYQLDMAKRCIDRLSGFIADRSEPKLQRKTEDPDRYYFDSYSQSYIHEVMLKDTQRTLAYENAITPHLFKDKVVLDVGSGTGILSLFAARAGAKAVYAVDDSNLHDVAKCIIQKNNYQKVIHPIKAKIEHAKLPAEQVDIIVSEWMGYALFFESMLPSVLHARDVYLSKQHHNGLLFPNTCTLYLQAATALSDLKFWEDVYGFDMTPLAQHLLIKERMEEATVEIVKPDSILTDTFPLISLSLYTCNVDQLDFTSSFLLNGIGHVHKLVLSFDVHFPITQEQKKVVLSTSPHDQPTHWKQTTLWLCPQGILLDEDHELKGEFSMTKGTINPREMEIVVHWELVVKLSEKIVSNGFVKSILRA